MSPSKKAKAQSLANLKLPDESIDHVSHLSTDIVMIGEACNNVLGKGCRIPRDIETLLKSLEGECQKLAADLDEEHESGWYQNERNAAANYINSYRISIQANTDVPEEDALWKGLVEGIKGAHDNFMEGAAVQDCTNIRKARLDFRKAVHNPELALKDPEAVRAVIATCHKALKSMRYHLPPKDGGASNAPGRPQGKGGAGTALMDPDDEFLEL